MQAFGRVVARAQRVVLLDAEAAHAAPRVLATHGVEVFDRERAVAPAEVELLLGARPKRLGATLQVLRQPGVPLSMRKVVVVEAQRARHKGLLGALPCVYGWKVACHDGAKGEPYWQVDVVQLESLSRSAAKYFKRRARVRTACTQCAAATARLVSVASSRAASYVPCRGTTGLVHRQSRIRGVSVRALISHQSITG